jgi:hypothetical protein
MLHFPKREKVTGGWRKFHNEEVYSLYFSQGFIGMIMSGWVKWLVNAAHVGDIRNAYQVLVGKPEGRKLFGRPRRTLEDNIKMDIKEIWCDGVDWIHLAQDTLQWRALVNPVMNQCI